MTDLLLGLVCLQLPEHIQTPPSGMWTERVCCNLDGTCGFAKRRPAKLFVSLIHPLFSSLLLPSFPVVNCYPTGLNLQMKGVTDCPNSNIYGTSKNFSHIGEIDLWGTGITDRRYVSSIHSTFYFLVFL